MANYRNKHLLQLFRQLSCSACGADDGTIVAAHSNQSKHGKGMGIKAHDCFVAALCHRCHSWLDQGAGSREAKVEFFDAAMIGTIGQLLAKRLVTISDEEILELWKQEKITVCP